MKTKSTHRLATLLALAFAPGLAAAFDSGSTGTDGALSPLVNTEVQLPPSGVLNYTTINIPTGVTVKFKKNATNTPVVLLASGNVTIAGTIDVSGAASPTVGAAGDGNVGDDGQLGKGGPGGYDGGAGGGAPKLPGSNGQGPGAGTLGFFRGPDNSCITGYGAFIGGGGGGYAASGNLGGPSSQICTAYNAAGGASYGASLLLPLLGGSGGGGGGGGSTFPGSGGGGGGGALLIAASATVNLTGTITASGGASGASNGGGCGASGGSGSGGAIRIIATTIAGNGGITANGGAVGTVCTGSSSTGWLYAGGAGSAGRIRLEAETITRTAASTPGYAFGAPGSIFIAGFPTLRITSVAGVAVPAEPTGNADVTLPSTVPNPVTVVFQTTGVPVGNTVKLTLTPAGAAATSVISPALTGATDNATASVQISLPSGPSTLLATTTYTIVTALGDALSRYAQGERVEKITLATALGGASKVILITVTGKEYEVPAALLATLG